MDSANVPSSKAKVIVIGDYSTGKSSLLRRYCLGSFSPASKVTIGVDFLTKKLRIVHPTHGEMIVVVEFWDIAGHERFGSALPMYYRNAVACVLVCDISRKATLDSLEKWAADVDQRVSLPGGGKIPKILLANKADLASATVTKEDVEKSCQKIGAGKWFYTSALSNLNVSEAFSAIVEEVTSRNLFVAGEGDRKPPTVGVRPTAGDGSSTGKANGNSGSKCC
jgi:Ras-related protein Rab-32